MSRTMFGWRSWRADRLTLSAIGSSAGISFCQIADLAARLPDGPLAERHDQPALLGERDELHRRDEAAARVLPADQRLDAGQAAGLEVDRAAGSGG